MTLLMIGTYYLYIGAAVAAVFVIFGMGRLDENAQGAWIFRPLMIPGVLLIWPLVLWRWSVLARGEQKLDRHRMPRIRQEWAQMAFVIAVPVILLTAMTLRQDPGTLPAPQQIEAAK